MCALVSLILVLAETLLCLGLFDEVLLEQPGVARVGAEDGVSNVTNKGNKTNTKVEHDVKVHAVLEGLGKAALNVTARRNHAVGKKEVDDIADARERSEKDRLLAFDGIR